MLKCTYPTTAAKLGVIAATYRAGSTSIYGSCPRSCPLLAQHHRTAATRTLDTVYLDAERRAVPRDGLAWSYTHFNPRPLFKNTNSHHSTLNVSTDTTDSAVAAFESGYDTTYVAPHTDLEWPRRIRGVPFVRCPAEANTTITCQTCGGGAPLCARQKRRFVIVFVAHGNGKKHITDKTGGCYASNFPCVKQWERTRTGIGPTTFDDTTDPERLVAWATALPKGTLLRHRIAGDLGLPFISA